MNTPTCEEIKEAIVTASDAGVAFSAIWRLLVPDWDIKGPGEVNPNDYSLPKKQSDVMWEEGNTRWGQGWLYLMLQKGPGTEGY